MPKITVFIPVRNRARYIGEAIESILGQTLSDFELLIIDDASTDDSVDRIQAFDDPRLRLVRNERNQGIPATRNRGVALAEGEYLAFLDSDDRALPGRLTQQLRFLEAHPDHAAVGGWMAWIDARGKRTGKIKRKAVSADQIAAERLFRAGLENSTAMARTAILRAYPHNEDFALGSDYELWARIGAQYKLAALPEVLIERRRHAGQSTAENKMKIKQGRLRIFAAQLAQLGIAFEPEDLERHFLLRRMHKVDFRPDAAYLDWADDWLTRLQAANHERGLYPEPAFTAVLGTFWSKTCLMALRNAGLATLPRFWRSPLRLPAWAGLRAEAKTRLRIHS